MMESYHQRHIEYIKNASDGNGRIKRRFFIEDWEPIGEDLVKDMVSKKLIKEVNIKGVDYIELTAGQ